MRNRPDAHLYPVKISPEMNDRFRFSVYRLGSKPVNKNRKSGPGKALRKGVIAGVWGADSARSTPGTDLVIVSP